MSDDEQYSEEEEVVHKSKRKSQASESGGMSDIEEKLRKKKEEEEAMWGEYIEQRKKQREKDEEELKKLKDRQARRKTQRAEQEAMLIEMKKKQEEQKQREIDEKKAREAEAKRKRLEEAEKKRQALLEAAEKAKNVASPNFVINKKDCAPASASSNDKFANMAFARSEMNKTKEQLAEDKAIAMTFRVKALNIEGLSVDKLRNQAQTLWEQIVQLESDKYDYEERQKRQDYDLKELNERQRQINRNKALKKGLDPEAFTGKYPPKINVANKFERRVDRRDYSDKKKLFEGGWEDLYKDYLEKSYSEREKEMKEKGDSKLPKWDPCNPRNKEIFEPEARTYDDGDEDIMDVVFKPAAPVQEEPAPPPRRAPEPEPEEEVEEEYEEEEEEE